VQVLVSLMAPGFFQEIIVDLFDKRILMAHPYFLLHIVGVKAGNPLLANLIGCAVGLTAAGDAAAPACHDLYEVVGNFASGFLGFGLLVGNFASFTRFKTSSMLPIW
jgi:hypothetical protein